MNRESSRHCPRRRAAPVAIALLTLLSLLSLLLQACGGSTPESTAESFYRAVEKGELTEAMEYLAPETYSDLGQDKVRAALELQTRRIDEQGGIQKFEVTESKILGEIADLEVRITLGDGSILDETVHLREIDGEWRIESRK